MQALIAPSSAAQRSSSNDLALIGGRIYTSATAQAIDDGVVIVKNGKIAEVGPRRSMDIPVGIATINCNGKVITAGFQNSHIHFTEDKWDGASRFSMTADGRALLDEHGNAEPPAARDRGD